jgi:hypothetical protein
MAKKRPSLSKLGLSQHVATKGEPAGKPRSSAASKKVGAGEKQKPRYLQTRLNDEGWEVLKMLSIAERRPLQSLLVESLNDLLRKYRKAPVIEGPADD